jgi:hypothetical protein
MAPARQYWKGLAVGSFGILVLHCRECDHLAVITFASANRERRV